MSTKKSKRSPGGGRAKREKSPTTVIDDLNFEELSQEFTRYYIEFDTALKSSPYGKGKGNHDPCYVLFGVSGAGKVRFVNVFVLQIPMNPHGLISHELPKLLDHSDCSYAQRLASR